MMYNLIRIPTCVFLAGMLGNPAHPNLSSLGSFIQGKETLTVSLKASFESQLYWVEFWGSHGA